MFNEMLKENILPYENLPLCPANVNNIFFVFKSKIGKIQNSEEHSKRKVRSQKAKSKAYTSNKWRTIAIFLIEYRLFL